TLEPGPPYELWETDGTAAGTVLVDSFRYPPGNMIADNGVLLFSAEDSLGGTELWRSDGTAAGTSKILGLNPNTANTNLPWMTLVNGLVYFPANDTVHGSELWATDGTASGTALVADIYPGSVGSNPSSLTNIDGDLFFAATDTTHGTELWTFQNSAPSTSGIANTRAAENSAADDINLSQAFADDNDASTNLAYALTGDTDPELFASTPIDSNGNLTLNYAPGQYGSATLTLCATDSGGLSTSTAFNVQVDVVNTAPTLNTSVLPQFSTIEENNFASTGDLVSALLATGAGAQPIADPDPGALEGIAIVAVDNTHGAWQFSLNDGSTWNSVGSPSATQALLLASDNRTRIRFVPSTGEVGTLGAGITFRAWDQTSGVNGATANTSSSGGSTAFSTAELSALLVVNPLPTVVGVYASSTQWAPSFVSMLDSAGLGDGSWPGLGFELADGANQLATMLPWTNIDILSVAFDEGVMVAPASLTLYDDAGNPIASTGFSYNAAAQVATWTFPTLASSKYWIGLSSAAVTDALGTALDGQWTTGVSTFAAGSGDGTPGGDFNFRFNVVPGDANDSGAVTNGDVLQTKLDVGAVTGPSNFRQDVNGSGNITNGDVLLTKMAVGSDLNSLPEPTLPALAPLVALQPAGSQQVDLAPDMASAQPFGAVVGMLLQSTTVALSPPSITVEPATPADVDGEQRGFVAADRSATTSLPGRWQPSSASPRAALPSPSSAAPLSAPVGSLPLQAAGAEMPEPSAAVLPIFADSLDWLAGPRTSLPEGSLPAGVSPWRQPVASDPSYAAIDAAFSEVASSSTDAVPARRWRVHLANFLDHRPGSTAAV
ncbi:MAG TPA: ELWxxDGT repeat protein, partial [Pirellulales bacterium]